MGLNWIIEGIVMITNDGTFSMILDMYNALTGVFIFGLFVLKPSVIHLIKKRFVLKHMHTLFVFIHYIVPFEELIFFSSNSLHSGGNFGLAIQVRTVPLHHIQVGYHQKNSFIIPKQC